MYDVAEIAGLSIGTVSRHVNGSGYVSEASRARIEAAIAETGFVPNSAARSLTTKRTGLVGFVVSDLRNPFSAELAHGINDRATHYGYCVLTAVTEDDEARAVRTLRVLREHHIDGLIVTPPESPAVKRELRALHTAGMAIVLIGLDTRPRFADRVTTSTYDGATQAMDHLIGLGHRRIALVSGERRRGVASGRRRAYTDRLRAAGIAGDDELIEEVALDRAGGADALGRFLKLRRPPSAIFASNDAAALGAMQHAAEHGLRVPDDLSIVGFDDVDLAEHSAPPLTTVAQPKLAMGTVAVDLLAARMRGGADAAPVERRLDCTLIVRSSTAAPRKN
jgi:LacI family transcriptional regulator